MNNLIRFLIYFTFFFRSVLASTSGDILREMLAPPNPVLHRKSKADKEKGETPFTVTLDFFGLVDYYDYPGEEYKVTTEDGYIITIHRVPGSSKSPPGEGKPVVFLQHGLMASSDSWVILSPESSLAFLLADEGYDVWLGNTRGNTYGREHQTLTTLDREFWRYSYHEIGIYDLPAMIDFVLDITSQKTMYYIGHSMGTTVSYILLSSRPEYNKKMRLVVSLAPSAIWIFHPNVYQFAKTQRKYIKRLLDDMKIYNLAPQSDAFVEMAQMCMKNKFIQSMCLRSLGVSVGANPNQFNMSYIGLLGRYFPAGASVDCVLHYAQNIADGNFRKFDHGPEMNIQLYGQEIPPVYELEKISAPFFLVYSSNDPFAIPGNVKLLAGKLQNAEMYEVADKKFNHLDYITAKDVKKLVNDKVIEVIAQY